MSTSFPIYVLNLKRDAHRKETVTKEMKYHDLQDVVEFIEAVDGLRLRKKDVEGKLSRTMQWVGHPSVQGCALSHLSIWQRMVDNQIPAAMIMEDDVVLERFFKTKVQKAIEELPCHADVLYVGALMTNDQEALPWYIDMFRSILQIGRSRQLCHLSASTIYQPQLALGTHCYYLTLKGAKKLLTHLKGNIYCHIDYMMMTVPHLQFYACHPLLANQKVNLESSSIAKGSHFPFCINHIMDDIPHFSGASMGYLLTTPLAQMSSQTINTWILFFFVTSFICVLLKVKSHVVFCLFVAFALADVSCALVLTRQTLGLDSLRSFLFSSIAIALPCALLTSAV